MEDMGEQVTLQILAEQEIEHIKTLSGPVVRVCGPLTADGPDGYERNAARLRLAEDVLEQKGYTVWRFGPSEATIQSGEFSHSAIMDYFHRPVLASGVISGAFFLPRWDESSGARQERALAEEYGIEIHDIPETWLQ